jgi:hypothetical protein
MQTVFSEALLDELRARNAAGKEDRDDTSQAPDDCDSRLSIELALGRSPAEQHNVMPALPAPPLFSEMPSSWWTPLLFGKPGDAVSEEDARLALALIEARLAEG